jgi:hypothetical protein
MHADAYTAWRCSARRFVRSGPRKFIWRGCFGQIGLKDAPPSVRRPHDACQQQHAIVAHRTEFSMTASARAPPGQPAAARASFTSAHANLKVRPLTVTQTRPSQMPAVLPLRAPGKSQPFPSRILCRNPAPRQCDRAPRPASSPGRAPPLPHAADRLQSVLLTLQCRKSRFQDWPSLNLGLTALRVLACRCTLPRFLRAAPSRHSHPVAPRAAARRCPPTHKR